MGAVPLFLFATSSRVGAGLPASSRGAGPSHSATAYLQKLPMWKAEFARDRLRFPPVRLFLRIFKREAAVEVWAGEGARAPMRKIKTYAIAASSGVLGPKRR